jgi:hypothetical protein
MTDLQRGLSTREFARLYRIGRGRVLAMLQRGELGGVNVAERRCGRACYRIMPHHIAAWEQSRAVAVAPAPARRRKQQDMLDYYP